MGEFMTWVQAQADGTKITGPFKVHLHAAYDIKSGEGQRGPWSNQKARVSDPGDPSSAGTYATFWNGIDLRNDIGATLLITPGPQGGGITIKNHWNDQTKPKEFDIRTDSADVKIDQAAPAQQQSTQPTQQQLPQQLPQQQPAQAQQPAQSQPGTQPAQGQPAQQQQPAQTQPAQNQQSQPAGNDPKDIAAREFRGFLMSYSEAWPLAFSAATHAWSMVSKAHGVYPSIEDLRCLTTSIMVQASCTLGNPKMGMFPTMTPKDPPTPASELLCKRASEDAEYEAFGREQRQRGQEAQPTNPGASDEQRVDEDGNPF